MTFPVIAASAEGVAQFLTAILIFLFVLALTYFTTRFVGEFQKKQYTYRNFEAIESFKIANGKYLQLVKIGEKYVVLGIGKDSVSVVCEVPADEIKTQQGQGLISKNTFRDIIEKARGFGNGHDDANDK